MRYVNKIGIFPNIKTNIYDVFGINCSDLKTLINNVNKEKKPMSNIDRRVMLPWFKKRGIDNRCTVVISGLK